MTPEVIATHERINQERKKLYDRFKEEFGHELNDEKISRVVDTLIKPPKGTESQQIDATIVTESKPRRGRPVGSKNKPKGELVKPSLIGHIPNSNFVVPKPPSGDNGLIIHRQD